MIILGIETSCDETSVACVEDGKNILSLVTATQINAHKKYGGVVPEIASRMHAEMLGEVTREALQKAGMILAAADYIAATSGPGLMGPLLVGVTFANALGFAAGKKCISINHLEAHIYSAFMENPELEAPLIALLVSGGHTVIVKMSAFGRHKIIGSTLDDAAGEAFDKVSNLLGLGYPGGPAIQKASGQGDASAVRFPRAMMKHKKKYDFSFSGLKTSVITKVRSLTDNPESLDEKTRCDIAASFQEAAVDALVSKTVACAIENRISRIVLAGGVAANSRLREKMGKECGRNSLRLFVPSLSLCGDNGAMIAGLAFHKTKEAVDFISDVDTVKRF
jgi:N6-L-threonylcarbamoyladenine synthase